MHKQGLCVIHISVYVSIYLSIYIYMSLSLSLYIYIYIEREMCICVHIYIYTRIRTHICMYVYIYIYIHIGNRCRASLISKDLRCSYPKLCKYVDIKQQCILSTTLKCFYVLNGCSIISTYFPVLS